MPHSAAAAIQYLYVFASGNSLPEFCRHNIYTPYQYIDTPLSETLVDKFKKVVAKGLYIAVKSQKSTPSVITVWGAVHVVPANYLAVPRLRLTFLPGRGENVSSS
jgi:hypothetical protein